MITLKNRLEIKTDIAELRKILDEVDSGINHTKASSRHIMCLGLSDEWLISNKIEVKEVYSNEESMRICKIRSFEQSLRIYLITNGKTLKDNARTYLFDSEPYVKLTDILPLNTYILLSSWCVSGHCSSMVEFNNETFLSIDYFRVVKNEEDFEKEMKENSNNKSEKILLQKTYVMIDHNTGFYKIGKSKNAIEREKTLASEKPTIELVLVCENNIETNLHKKFREKRIRGEWFDLQADDILELIEKYEFKKPLK